MLPTKMLSSHTANKVVVAVRAEKKEISKTAIAWALTHIVQPGDCITLLAVLPSDTKSGRKLWSFPIFNGDCGSNQWDKSPTDQIYQISKSCSQMLLQFTHQNQVGVKIKVVSGSPGGVVAAESKKAGANWVILDKHLTEEEKHCMEELHCNIVVMKQSQAKILRVRLGSSNDLQLVSSSPSIYEFDSDDSQNSSIKHSTPVNSPEHMASSFTKTTIVNALLSRANARLSPLFLCEQNPLFEGHKKEKAKPMNEEVSPDTLVTVLSSERDGGYVIGTPTSARKHSEGKVYWIPQNHYLKNNKITKDATSIKNNKITKDATSKTLLEKFVQTHKETKIQALWSNQANQIGHVFNSDVRDVVSLSRSSSAPPPLCSLCQHKAPVFGKPPRLFDYGELDTATDGFSESNRLAKGTFGSVHRGVLRDGQVVAVKQLNITVSLGEAEFCREVGILSCARHRNVVMLIGFCIERQKRVVVYEYVCNGSLDSHLYGGKKDPLDWHSRVKVAIGTARGLRYLHEDCRVGCIVHRDMSSNNILLTHDFEPLVGDFGITKWHQELDIGSTTRAVRALGYLKPEYNEDANVTEKADIYAFGVVLKELITGRKTADMARFSRQHLLAQWYYHLLALEEQSQTQVINHSLVDPCLDPDQLRDCSHQLQAMARAASLCLRRDPESRPPMSKVLRTLQGGNAVIPLTHKLDSVGNRSGRLSGLSSKQGNISKGSHCRRLSH